MRIAQTYIIQASPERVWAALTEPALQKKWTGAHAEYDARVGGTYKLWDDYVSGAIVECVAPKKLAQTWKPADWTIENSVVTFTLKKIRGGTQLDLVHENVQPEDYDSTRDGWKNFYVGAIKKSVEGEKRETRTRTAKSVVRTSKSQRQRNKK